MINGSLKNKVIMATDKHWQNMIKFAKTQPMDAPPNYSLMRLCIGETINSESCPLCTIYGAELFCRNCPLSKIDEWCYNENSQYNKTVESKTWGDFITEAEKMRAVIEKEGMS